MLQHLKEPETLMLSTAVMAIQNLMQQTGAQKITIAENMLTHGYQIDFRRYENQTVFALSRNVTFAQLNAIAKQFKKLMDR